MPDVIVKGMKMPDDCGECRFQDTDYGVCTADKEYRFVPKYDKVKRCEPRPDWCPLKECETTDKITLFGALQDPPVWMMVYAADPLKPINVRMTYADLFMIRKFYDVKALHGEKEGEQTDGNSVFER